MTVAVIIAAYQAQAWLMDCVYSVVHSSMAVDASVQIRIGVDACHETAQVLDLVARPYWWSPVNVGPYVMRNSLIALAPADVYVIFDADDVMLPNYFPALVWMPRQRDIFGPSRIDCDEHLQPIKSSRFRHGVCAFRANVLERLGSYKAERLAADIDFIARAASIGIVPHVTPDVCYLRRRHPASLTKSTETGIGTRPREAAKRRMERERASAGARVYVPPVTTPLEYRGQEARTA